jgi:hypothetical protein
VKKLVGSKEIISLVKEFQDKQGFKELHWEGSFEDYLEIIKYRFFNDHLSNGQDAVYGWEKPIMQMINFV